MKSLSLGLLLTLMAATPAFATPIDDSLTKYECSNEWAGWMSTGGNGLERSVGTCSNGRKYNFMNASCTYLDHGLFFTSREQTVVGLLCEVGRDSVQTCLADNINNAAEIAKCQAEFDADRAEFISNSHAAN